MTSGLSQRSIVDCRPVSVRKNGIPCETAARLLEAGERLACRPSQAVYQKYIFLNKISYKTSIYLLVYEQTCSIQEWIRMEVELPLGLDWLKQGRHA